LDQRPASNVVSAWVWRGSGMIGVEKVKWAYWRSKGFLKCVYVYIPSTGGRSGRGGVWGAYDNKIKSPKTALHEITSQKETELGLVRAATDRQGPTGTVSDRQGPPEAVKARNREGPCERASGTARICCGPCQGTPGTRRGRQKPRGTVKCGRDGSCSCQRASVMPQAHMPAQPAGRGCAE